MILMQQNKNEGVNVGQGVFWYLVVVYVVQMIVICQLVCIWCWDISVDVQVVFIKYYVEVFIESQINFLSGVEMDVVGQQNFDVVVVVVLVEQIGIVVQMFYYFILKFYYGIGGDFWGEVFWLDFQCYCSVGFQWLGGDIQGQLMVLCEGDC